MTDTAIGFLLLGIAHARGARHRVRHLVARRAGRERAARRRAASTCRAPASCRSSCRSGPRSSAPGSRSGADDQFANLWLAIPGVAVLRPRHRRLGRAPRTTSGAIPSTGRTTTGPRTEPPMTAGSAASAGAPTCGACRSGYLVVAAIAPAHPAGVVLGRVLLARAPARVADDRRQPWRPTSSLADLDGNPIRLADLRGRPVIVNFWASWCGPCVEEFPLLRDAAARHADDGLAVVGIVCQDRSEAARDFMARNGGTWPAAMDPGERVASAYGILGPPETFFIGRDGTIAARQFGPVIGGARSTEQLAAIYATRSERWNAPPTFRRPATRTPGLTPTVEASRRRVARRSASRSSVRLPSPLALAALRSSLRLRDRPPGRLLVDRGLSASAQAGIWTSTLAMQLDSAGHRPAPIRSLGESAART